MNEKKYLILLYNSIYSTKVFFNDLFYQIYIMNHFDTFNYSHFFDSRGRLLFECSALNIQNTSIVRCFISFYDGGAMNDLLLNPNDKVNEIKKTTQLRNFKYEKYITLISIINTR